MTQSPKNLPVVSPATVALIAAGIIERRVRFRELEASDFTPYEVPGTGMSYMTRTHQAACAEAWLLIRAAEETRPPTP